MNDARAWPISRTDEELLAAVERGIEATASDPRVGTLATHSDEREAPLE